MVYVNTNATGSNTGENWTNAFTDLQDALTQADVCPGVSQIWVATGTYLPPTDESFAMKEGVEIYGSFNETEALLADRVLGTEYSTVLQGNGNSVIQNEINSALRIGGRTQIVVVLVGVYHKDERFFELVFLVAPPEIPVFSIVAKL